MSIAPVPSFPPARNEQPANTGAHSGKPATRSATEPTEKDARPVSGTLPEQESSVAKKISAVYELPQDVVEVHLDPETKNQIIIQYLDQSKNVILQVPSGEELDVERGIAQEFQQATKLRASAGTAAVGSEGEKTHGH